MGVEGEKQSSSEGRSKLVRGEKLVGGRRRRLVGGESLV